MFATFGGLCVSGRLYPIWIIASPVSRGDYYGEYGSPSGAEVPKLNSPHENQYRNLNNSMQ